MFYNYNGQNNLPIKINFRLARGDNFQLQLKWQTLRLFALRLPIVIWTMAAIKRRQQTAPGKSENLSANRGTSDSVLLSALRLHIKSNVFAAAALRNKNQQKVEQPDKQQLTDQPGLKQTNSEVAVSVCGALEHCRAAELENWRLGPRSRSRKIEGPTAKHNETKCLGEGAKPQNKFITELHLRG